MQTYFYRMYKRGSVATLGLFMLLAGGTSLSASAQTTTLPTPATTTPTAPPPTYPRMVGYLGLLHPLITVDANGTEGNFNKYYAVGFPIGLNVWKTQQLGFSLEIVPSIRAENGTSRVANVLFHPGVLVNLGHNYTFAGRMAFETSGRYGLTPVFNKIVRKGATNSYFVAVPLPLRFGNDRPTSLTVGLQVGIVF